MTITTLATQFQMAGWIAGQNLAGLTHEDSLVRATPGSNCINWLVGHVAATRHTILGVLGATSPWNDAQAAMYLRGAEPVTDDAYVPFDDLVRALDATFAPLLAAVQGLTPEQLDAPAPFSPGGGSDTIGSLLAKIAMHEAYHLGQTGILRRVAGKPGAIQ